MGVGKPIDIVEAVYRGIDMFDCVIPTRSGRHGQVWTDAGPYNIKNARFSEDNSALDSRIACPASQNYSRAYVHHLMKSKELLGAMILSWHNIAYFQNLMQRIRASISDHTFDEFVKNFRMNSND